MTRKMLMLCQALDTNGRRCRSSKGVAPVKYHGSDELYGFCSNSPEPKWVHVLLCEKHRKATP